MMWPLSSWVAVPVAANLLALCLTLGIYGSHLRHEQQSSELQHFIRRLGLSHVLIVDVGVVVLILLCCGASAVDVAGAVSLCLVGSTSAATLALKGVPPTRLERRLTHP